MRFRPANEADIPSILPMLRAQYQLHVGWDPAKFAVLDGFDIGYGRWLTQRTSDPRAVFLVATTTPLPPSAAPPQAFPPECPIAFLIGTIEHELPLYVLRQFGFIHDLYVEPGYRNEGVARQLVTLALERFRELGVRQVRCETTHVNEPARSLFFRCGFRVSTINLLTQLPE